MRKYLILLSITSMFCNCSKSIEEKAKDLVTDNLRESVTNKKSLQVISISVDSCFYDIVAVDKVLQEYLQVQMEYDALCSKEDFAKERVEVARETAKNVFGIALLQNLANQQANAHAARTDYLVSVLQPKESEILSILRPEGTKEFQCYKVSVKYKTEASKGNLKEHTATYYVKADITGIIKAIDLENDTCRHYKQKLRFEEYSIPKML